MAKISQPSLWQRLSSWLPKHPRTCLLTAFILCAALASGLPRLQSDFSYRIWFRPNDPLIEEFKKFEYRFGNDDATIIVVNSPTGIFDTDSMHLIQELTDRLWKAPDVIRVDSVANSRWTRGEGDTIVVDPLIPENAALTAPLLQERKRIALSNEMINGLILSADAQTTVLFATLKPALDGQADYTSVIEGIRSILKDFEGRTDHTFYVTGSAAIDETFREVSKKDSMINGPMLVFMVATILFLVFRSIWGVLILFIVIALSIACTLGTAGWFGIKYNSLLAMMPSLLITIGIAYSVHVLMEYVHYRKLGFSALDSCRLSLSKNLYTTFLTCSTTAVGFLSDLTSDLIPIAHLGILTGLGAILVWILTISLLVPVMVWFPIKVKTQKKMADLTEEEAMHLPPSPWAVSLVHWIDQKKIPIIILFFGGFFVSLYVASRNEINSSPYEYFSDDVPLKVANKFLEANVGAGIGPEIVIDSGSPDGIKNPEFLAKVEKLEAWLQSKPFVTKTISVTNILKQTNRALNGNDPREYKIPSQQDAVAQQLFLYTMSLPQGLDLNNRMTLDYSAMRLSVFWKIHDSKSSLAEIDRVEAYARDLGLKAQVSGKVPLFQRTNPYVVTSFFQSALLGITGISLILLFAFRSFKLGFLSLIPNVLPLAFGGAFMTIIGRPIDIGTVMIIGAWLGVAVDDTVHFLGHYRDHIAAGFQPKDAIARIISTAGLSLIVSNLVIVAGFATFMVASFMPTHNFGMMTAFILTMALLAELCLTPSLLLLRAKKN